MELALDCADGVELEIGLELSCLLIWKKTCSPMPFGQQHIHMPILLAPI
jgi:hypothetical protein